MRLGRTLPIASVVLLSAVLVVGPTGSTVVPGVDSLPEDSVPTYHETPEEFSVFDAAVTAFMEERGITAASLAVAVDGEQVWEQGYGWTNPHAQDTSPVVEPDAPFRIASLTKPHVNAVVYHLADQGQLAFDDKAFCLEQTNGPCHLDIAPYDGDLGDERLAGVTVSDLLSHAGGWDRDEFGDPMFMSAEIADAMDVESPPTTEQVVSFMLAQELDFAPGTEYAYSNLGYGVLGLVIEEVTGEDFVDVIKHVVHDVPLDEVGDAGDDGVDVEEGRTLTPERNEREPVYHCGGVGPHVFDPIRQTGAPTCWPDGAWSLEDSSGSFALIASSPALLDLATEYWWWGEERDGTCDSCWGWHTGALSGTHTVLFQRPDGLDFTIAINKRYDAQHGYYYDLKDVINEAADSYLAEHHGISQSASGAAIETDRWPAASPALADRAIPGGPSPLLDPAPIPGPASGSGDLPGEFARAQAWTGAAAR